MAENEQSKAQRLIDLLAALLRHSTSGISLAQLRNEVPGYWGDDRLETTVAMMFERDKGELRELGVQIDGVADTLGNVSRYRLDPTGFYLPYLESPWNAPSAAGGLGTAMLPTIGFGAPQLFAIAQGVERLRHLGHPMLAEQARAGLRRLAHDLPMFELEIPRELVQGERGVDSDVLETLGDAVRRRKRITFSYHALERAEATERHACPFGLAYIEGRWYLFARDDDAGALRQFRLRRMSALRVNPKKSATPDFDVPEDFDLWSLTKSRQGWELGSEPPREITVRFTGETGVTSDARARGKAVQDAPDQRSYQVRRLEPFLRWVLGFAGEATISAPADVAAEFRALVASVAQRHMDEVPA